MDLWIQIKTLLVDSNRSVKINEGLSKRGAEDIDKINVSPESVMGAVIANTSGIVVDNWINILGQSSDQNPGVVDFNVRTCLDFGEMLAVALDAVGGVFALNMGRFEEDRGMVWYFAPDTLSWESLGFKYSEFIAWISKGDLDGYYSSFRWNDWKKDVEGLDGFNYGIQIYPFLWSKECDIETASRKIIPIKEIISCNLDFEKKFSS